ncbi:aminoglycoside adenylyltransferase domain-containing protein [Nocardioides limicola]|uniref:aminoglycoside adenylyltransferase domain-containing protein n=1 Tax=Nocardioides limicola TaxID=2803368 RepID=UPI00193BAC2B|nr:aminoglycoside adenylyltransferase domain-containing protein [Nocardioides sp. DJM-14]
MTSLPEEVAALCRTFLDTIDARAPGLVTGLYLRGGLAFGEYLPGTSDVDFVAVLSGRPSTDEQAALESAHAEVAARHPEPAFDGMHLLVEDLRRHPDDCPDLPCVIHGWFDPAGREDVNPVAWHEVAEHGVAVRGPAATELGVWTDADALREFTRDNLDNYWRQSADALAKFPDEAAGETTCAWCVLGVARLDHLLVTGTMTTKSAAGRWGLTHYPGAHHRVLREALRIRAGDPGGEYDDPAERGADVTAFTRYVVDLPR